MKVKQLDVNRRPIELIGCGGMFVECPIVGQPDPAGELAVCAQD